MATAKKTWITILIAAFIRGADDNPTFRKLPVAARAEHAELRMLHVRLYDPDDGKIVRVEIPFWLIRFGMSVSLVRGMESVSLEDLERHGPGLIINGQGDNGQQVLVWSD